MICENCIKKYSKEEIDNAIEDLKNVGIKFDKDKCKICAGKVETTKEKRK